MERSTGKLTWTPGEEQGPGQYQATVRAAVAGSPSVFHQQTVRITVNEVARPRSLTRSMPASCHSETAPGPAIGATRPRYPCHLTAIFREHGARRRQPRRRSMKRVSSAGNRLRQTSASSTRSVQGVQGVGRVAVCPAVHEHLAETSADRHPPPRSRPRRLPCQRPRRRRPPHRRRPHRQPPSQPYGNCQPGCTEPTATAKKKAEVPEAEVQKKAAEKIETIFRSSLPHASPKIGDRWPGSSCGKLPAPTSWPSATCC